MVKGLKFFFSSLIIFSAVSLIIYFNYEGVKYKDEIYSNSIASLVTKVEYKNRGGYIYCYKGGTFWASTFMDSREQILIVGDSISKKSNSLSLEVYRKNKTNEFKYLRTYQRR